MTSLTASTAWRDLGAYRESAAKRHMRELFAEDPERARRYSLTFDELYLDYSKNRIDDRGMALLMKLARDCGLPEAIRAMFAGDPINVTERRAVLHTALRKPAGASLKVAGSDVMPAVREVLRRLQAFSERVRTGQWTGYTGKPIADVVNIGIGGSHLGPQMVCEALDAYSQAGLRCHFVSNIDGADISRTLRPLDPATTLFIVASKSFTTQETMTNAHTARRWFLEHGGAEGDVGRHFVAVSTNAAAVESFGIDTDNMFGFWNWVGGRYSLWSAIGLPIILSVGFERFEELLAGAHAMDEHFLNAPLERNWPAILGMLGVWYVNFLGCRSHAILPYADYLRWLPDYLQQADMESNGKHARVDGAAVDYDTGPVIWGSTGTNGQHAYFQLLHQGTHTIPADFIAVVNPPARVGEHHELLLANCLAQSEALMLGRDLDDTVSSMRASGLDEDAIARLAPHRAFSGNRPSNTILMKSLTPRNLGSLLALYEHRIFVQGVIWNINSFDQWGVELGKQLAAEIHPELAGRPGAGRNSSTAALMDYCRRNTGRD